MLVCYTVAFLASTIHSQDKIVPVGGTFNLTCTSTISSNTMFSWTRNRMPVNGETISNGDMSTLTVSDVKSDNAGSYVCTVRVGTLVVMSNTVVITAVIIGMLMSTSVL